MQTVKAKTWNDVVAFYQSLSAENPYFRPMLDLVQAIANSRYGSGLFPATSMHDLLLAQTSEFVFGQEMIRVSQTASNKFAVEFHEAPSPNYQPWRRQASPEQAFGLFEHLLTLKKWFVMEAYRRE